MFIRFFNLQLLYILMLYYLHPFKSISGVARNELMLSCLNRNYILLIQPKQRTQGQQKLVYRGNESESY